MKISNQSICLMTALFFSSLISCFLLSGPGGVGYAQNTLRVSGVTDRKHFTIPVYTKIEVIHGAIFFTGVLNVDGKIAYRPIYYRGND